MVVDFLSVSSAADSEISILVDGKRQPQMFRLRFAAVNMTGTLAHFDGSQPAMKVFVSPVRHGPHVYFVVQSKRSSREVRHER